MAGGGHLDQMGSPDAYLEHAPEGGGSVYARRITPRGTNFLFTRIAQGRGWRNTTQLVDGDYEISAGGQGWSLAAPLPRVRITKGTPDPKQLTLFAVPTEDARIEFDLSLAEFVGASVSVVNEHGALQAVPDVEQVGVSATQHWDHPHLYIGALDAPTDIVIYFPVVGGVVLINVAPGEFRKEIVDRGERRVFGEALAVARGWKERAPWCGPVFLQVQADARGRDGIWLNVGYYNLGVDGYLDESAWELPVLSKSAYRIKAFDENGEAVFLPVDVRSGG